MYALTMPAGFKGIITKAAADQIAIKDKRISIMHSKKDMVCFFSDTNLADAKTLPLHYAHTISVLPRTINKIPVESVGDYLLAKFEDFTLVEDLATLQAHVNNMDSKTNKSQNGELALETDI